MSLRADARGGEMAINANAIKPLALSVANAARAVGIGRSTLWLHIGRGEVPTVRLGRRTLVRVAALDEWLKRQECTP